MKDLIIGGFVFFIWSLAIVEMAGRIDKRKKRNIPRRKNGQFKRKVPVKSGGKVIYYIYL